MTRQEYIDAVKVKLEEISPFKEPDHFIDGTSDPDFDCVKPIVSYIEKNLDEAARNCLRSLPLSLLHADIERKTDGFSVDMNGVGFITGINANYRYLRFRHAALKRDITAFITSEDPLYLVQQNEHVRGGLAKPVAVLASYAETGNYYGQIEIYSFKPKMAEAFDPSAVSTAFMLLYINTEKKVGVATDFTPALTPAQAQAQLVQSPIEDLIVLECAKMVFNILGNFDGAKVCENEQAEKIQAILK